MISWGAQVTVLVVSFLPPVLRSARFVNLERNGLGLLTCREPVSVTLFRVRNENPEGLHNISQTSFGVLYRATPQKDPEAYQVYVLGKSCIHTLPIPFNHTEPFLVILWKRSFFCSKRSPLFVPLLIYCCAAVQLVRRKVPVLITLISSALLWLPEE
ncbi:hypothetical protein H920_06611 [Fukomys damarensis]|uniref:Uncharacterized protein n=1 Tax=Fukomys damarensis TaxID=885580 RepID=A0A091DLQ9_FUKDA|nr:hypothetical protein H920_06611 [Fukomys damarensis]